MWDRNPLYHIDVKSFTPPPEILMDFPLMCEFRMGGNEGTENATHTLMHVSITQIGTQLQH